MKVLARFLLTGLLAVFVFALVAGGAAANNGTTVYRFADEPFSFDQSYSLSDPYLSGPATTFGQDVWVHYDALNSETVRFQGTDVDWSLIQTGTATVYSAADDSVLYQGPFQVEEHARDIGGDAGCATADGHAWLGKCTDLYGALDWANYQWKITGASVYYYDLSITAPGQGCFSSRPGGGYCWG